MLDLDHAASLAVNGTELAVVERGTGPPVVMVHGGVSDLRSWSGQIDAFAAGFRTIVYSRRYHRPNAPIPADAPDPIRVHVADLAALIGTLRAGPAHLVGHSWGGLIVLMLAMERPDLCRSLTLVEPPVLPLHVTVPPKPLQMLALLARNPRLAFAIARLGSSGLGPAATAFRRGDDEAAVAHLGRGILGPERFAAMTRGRYAQVWENRGPDRAQALFGGFPDLRAASLAPVAMPVLLVSGAESPPVFGLLLDDLARRLPNAVRAVIPGASHIVQEDATEAFNREVLAFLARVGA